MLERQEEELLETLEPAIKGVCRILKLGAQKYGMNNWLQSNGAKSSPEAMHNSMFHHLAQSYCNQLEDEESSEDPLLHLTTRAMMLYVIRHKGIQHD